MECLDYPTSDLPGLYWLAVERGWINMLYNQSALRFMLTPAVNGVYRYPL